MPWQVSRVGVDGTSPGNIGNDCGISEASSPSLIGIIGATVPTCGLNVTQEIGPIQQSTSPYLKQSNKLDSSIIQQFTDSLVVPPVSAEGIGDKLS